MSKKLVIVTVVALVLFLSGIIWRSTPPKEPVYGGKALSEWLSAYDWNNQQITSFQTRIEANAAVTHIGTKAIPTLMRMLHRRDSILKRRLYLLAKRQTIVKLRYQEAGNETIKAKTAFQELGPQKIDLMPQLNKVYEENPNVYSRQVVVVIASYVAPEAEETVPFLMRALADTKNDLNTRRNAAIALGKIRKKPDLAVPALTRALSDSEPFVQEAAASSLGLFCFRAQSARPTLVALLRAEKEKSKVNGPQSWLNSREFMFDEGGFLTHFVPNLSASLEDTLQQIEINDAVAAEGLK